MALAASNRWSSESEFASLVVVHQSDYSLIDSANEGDRYNNLSGWVQFESI